MVRGYHVYKAIWEAVDGETLNCCRETTNRLDPFVVAVKKQGVLVGHLPKKFLLLVQCSSDAKVLFFVESVVANNILEIYLKAA